MTEHESNRAFYVHMKEPQSKEKTMKRKKAQSVDTAPLFVKC